MSTDVDGVDFYHWPDIDLIMFAKDFDGVKAVTEDEQLNLIWVLANRLEEKLG